MSNTTQTRVSTKSDQVYVIYDATATYEGTEQEPEDVATFFPPKDAIIASSFKEARKIYTERTGRELRHLAETSHDPTTDYEVWTFQTPEGEDSVTYPGIQIMRAIGF